MRGNACSDDLLGNAGNDGLFGGAGTDWSIGRGDDLLGGAARADVFVFEPKCSNDRIIILAAAM